MRNAADNPVITDGTYSFSGGVDSIRVSTLKSAANPDGLDRNQLAWLNNATVRDGGISPRAGWVALGKVHDGSALYQGGFLYEPDNANPFLVLSIGGRIYKFDPDNPTPVDLSHAFNLTNPPKVDQAFFQQGEQFLIIQAGDNVTLPLFFDGTTMRRSHGITGNTTGPNINELPAATAMDYFMGRLWYAQGRQYSAGDIVQGPSGTLAYNFRDAILKVTENPLATGGDGFIVPDNAGNIRAITHSSNINTTLGQGQLLIGTRTAIYALTVPVTRANWIAANSANQPVQTVAQQTNGFVNDRSIVAVNGDLFYQSLEPAIRSFISAQRYYDQWGNVPISAAINRVLQFNDRSLLRFGSGIQFDNRMIQTALPIQTPQGVIHQCASALDFVPVSTFPGAAGTQEYAQAPAWEGIYQGLQILQLFEGDFGGRQRAFAVVVSELDSSIQVWEMIVGEMFDANGSRITWQVEFPAFTWGKEMEKKRLLSGELWVDRVYGTVDFTMEYRPDGETCWIPWHQWEVCSAQTQNDNPLFDSASYPVAFGASYQNPMGLPKPPQKCGRAMGQPTDVGYQFQCRLTVHGSCRLRSLLLHATMIESRMYQNIHC